jgi:hypothetical protein
MTGETGPAGQQCLNCGADLAGQYCGQCGQRATNRLISLWELMRDAFGDMFELDSRLWRTLIPLMLRPGRLTSDYLRGRRMRYMPPFRMYLVLSLLFFLVVFFDPRQELALLFEPAGVPAAADAGDVGAPATDAESDAAARQTLEDLVEDGVVDESVLERFDSAVNPDDDEAAGDAPGVNLNFGDDEARCNVDEIDLADAPEFIQRRITHERLRHVCERVHEVGPTGVLRAMLDNVPVALLLLLPLVALVLKLLYPLSRRYYVEHLLFIVHFHAFLFLLLTLQVLWARFMGAVSAPSPVSVLPIVATSFYIPVYLFRSMRTVYEQGRALTLVKFLVLVIAYSIGLTVMLLGALLITVFSI